jgi:c-di-AMP phosphodiesterase-like protein
MIGSLIIFDGILAGLANLILLKENFVKNGIRLSISQGISEYPTTAKYSTDLDESAQSALHFISNKGGDKICLAKPTKNHHPDFVVAE